MTQRITQVTAAQILAPQNFKRKIARLVKKATKTSPYIFVGNVTQKAFNEYSSLFPVIGSVRLETHIPVFSKSGSLRCGVHPMHVEKEAYEAVFGTIVS